MSPTHTADGRTRRGAVLAVLAVLAAAGTMAGCGATPPSADELVRDTVRGYVTALAEGDYATACAALSPRARKLLARSLGPEVTCREALARCLPRNPTIGKRDQTQLLYPDLTVRIRGSRAAVGVSGTAPAREVRHLTLTRTHGRWRLTSFGEAVTKCTRRTGR